MERSRSWYTAGNTHTFPNETLCKPASFASAFAVLFVTVLNYFHSAGIGRTGVLITMETALSQLHRGRPVFPLDIVKTLRDQRAMMVQTTVQ